MAAIAVDAALVGDSSQTAGAVMAYAVGAGLAGDSSQAGAGGVHFPITTPGLAGDSSSTAGLVNLLSSSFSGEASLSGAVTVEGAVAATLVGSASIVAPLNLTIADVAPFGASVETTRKTLQDGFTSFGAGGRLWDVGVRPHVNGRGTYGPVVISELLPGATIQAQGRGQLPLVQGEVLGRKGALQVSYIAGATGVMRPVVCLSDGTHLLCIKVDTFNRPFAVIEDIAGTVVAESDPLGPTKEEGARGDATVTWDSTALVAGGGGLYAAFKDDANGIFPIADWSATMPISTWAAFAPSTLLLGMNLTSPAEDFNGTVQKVQVSDLSGF